MKHLTLITRIVMAIVIVGLALLVTGWLDEIEPIEQAWISPSGEALLVVTATDQALSYDLDDLKAPLVRRALAPGARVVAWADARNVVLRRGRAVLVLGLDDLIERPWFESDSEILLLGSSGRTLMGIDPALPEAPISTFSLTNWTVGALPAPGDDARGLPFESLLVPADVRPEGVSLDLEGGRLTIVHPRLEGARRLSLPRPRLWAVGLVLGLAVVLFVLRRVHDMRTRLARKRSSHA